MGKYLFVWDIGFLKFIARFAVVNIVPFFLVFNLLLRRRKHSSRGPAGELQLLADEIKTVGILGYFVILSIFFLSIPVLQYLNTRPGYNILLVQPDGVTVFLIASLSFLLVVSGVYLKERRRWAFRLLLFLITALMGYSFFAVLEFGLLAIVPVVLFSYLFYRLKRPTLRKNILGR